jgi:alpha-N-arabinofuranosidase
VARPDFTSRYTLSDALAVSVWLNVFIRQSKYVAMANIAQSINVISPLMTTKTGLVKQTTWWPLLLFSKYMHGHTIGVHVRCPEYEGLTAPEWIRGTVETPWLDVSASLADDGWMTLAVVNNHETKGFATKVDGIPEGEVLTFCVTGESVNVTNTEDKQEVEIKESTWDGKGLYEFQKHSLTMLRWKAYK